MRWGYNRIPRLIELITDHIYRGYLFLLLIWTLLFLICPCLKSLKPILIPVSSRHPKSVSCEVVKETSLCCGIDTIGRYDTVSQGLDYALSIASEKDLVLATGSLSVVAEVSEAINQISPEFYYNLP